MSERSIHLRLPEDLLAQLDHAAAVWTLDEIQAGSPTKHTRSSIIREAVTGYLKVAFADVLPQAPDP